MQLYDSLRQKLVPIQPIDDYVRMYVCGVTPYDTTHMGHALTYIVYDSIGRFVEWQGFPILYVQNVTDIDDDILRKSAELGMTWDELGNRETARFLRDLKALNVRMPHHYVKATEAIEKIVEVSQGLLDKGFAYERNGNVYFSVASDPNFGALAHTDYATMLATANERGNFPDDPNKNDPLDFVLWQAGKPGEPMWNSPWSQGRPGWHIECTALVLEYLGPKINIHGGGGDLQFPHHTCEMAQAENYTEQKPHVEAWSHVGMLYYGGEKMSKSLGNLVLADNLLKTYSSDAIRLGLLKHHYREPFEYIEDDTAWGERTAERFKQAVNAAVGGGELSAEQLRAEAIAALDNDFDTPTCIQAMITLAEGAINGDIDDAELAVTTVRELGDVLGLRVDQW